MWRPISRSDTLMSWFRCTSFFLQLYWNRTRAWHLQKPICCRTITTVPRKYWQKNQYATETLTKIQSKYWKNQQFRCISTMGKNVKPHQKGPRKASTARSHVSKFGSLGREIFAGKEQYHKRTDTKHWKRENCWLPLFTHDFLSFFRSGCDHYQQLKQNNTLILTWDQAQF